jgi:hypothetical protein
MAQIRHGNVRAIPFEQPVNPIVYGGGDGGDFVGYGGGGCGGYVVEYSGCGCCGGW